MSGQKFIKNAKNGPFRRVFENLNLSVKECYQKGQFWLDKIGWNVKIQEFKCDILSDFQTLCTIGTAICQKIQHSNYFYETFIMNFKRSEVGRKFNFQVLLMRHSQNFAFGYASFMRHLLWILNTVRWAGQRWFWNSNSSLLIGLPRHVIFQ